MWGPAGRLRDLDFPIWVKICCNWGSTSTPGELTILRKTNFMKKLQTNNFTWLQQFGGGQHSKWRGLSCAEKGFLPWEYPLLSVVLLKQRLRTLLVSLCNSEREDGEKQPYCQAKPSLKKERRGLEDPRWRSAGGPCWPRWDRPATWWTSRRGRDHSGRGGGDEREEMWKFLSLGSW